MDGIAASGTHTVLAEADGTAYRSLRQRPVTRAERYALGKSLRKRVPRKSLADWTAPSPDVWTVPIGLGLGKVVKFGRLPAKIQLAVQYMPVHPRISGQEWNVQVQITPVIPKLIKGVLFQ